MSTEPGDPVVREGRKIKKSLASYVEATERARAVVRPGDRVTRRRCCDARSTFTFSHWDGSWMCGRTLAVMDCAASHVVAVNGVPVDFTKVDGVPISLMGDLSNG